MTQPLVVIFGGGVSGLYTRAILSRAGFHTVLIEDASLGNGQTIASQGILHRGVKYALSASASQVAAQLASATDEWEQAMRESSQDTESINLRSLRVLTRTMHLWTRPGIVGSLAGSITGTAASLAMKSGVKKLTSAELPIAFSDAPRSTHVWEVKETCIDARSLLQQLVLQSDHPIVRLERNITPSQAVASLSIAAVVLCAGCGNDGLLKHFGYVAEDYAQRRPLHMVAMHDAPFDVYAHCLQELSDKPRLTITTQTSESGSRTWYIGGMIAENGIDKPADAQIAAARAELASCMPWITQSKRWTTHRIDRAEGKTPQNARPDGPVIHRLQCNINNVPMLAAWPTKLALTPVLAKQVLGILTSIVSDSKSIQSDTPSRLSSDIFVLQPPVNVAEYPWT